MLACFLPAWESPVSTIRIVADSPDNMKLFRTLLTLRGHEIIGLAGGDGLLEMPGRGQPAV